MRELLYNVLVQAGQSFSYDAQVRGGYGLGELMWRMLPARREVATAAIIKHLGKSAEEAERLAHTSFRENCRSFMEVMLIRRLDPRFVHERVTIMHPERMVQLVSDSVPAVAVTGHLGAWELMVSIEQLLFHRPVRNVVVRRVSDQALSKVMRRQRTRPGVDILEHRKAVFPVLKGLKKGGMSSFLVDHNCTRSEAVFLPFLNDVAAVNFGPALLAVRAKAAIWPAFFIRKSEGRYELHLEEPLYTTELKGDRREKMLQTARFYTQAMETYVRRYPEQWLWMHKRWKTRPEPGDMQT